jgi:hypothetical protein
MNADAKSPTFTSPVSGIMQGAAFVVFLSPDGKVLALSLGRCQP